MQQSEKVSRWQLASVVTVLAILSVAVGEDLASGKVVPTRVVTITSTEAHVLSAKASGAQDAFLGHLVAVESGNVSRITRAYQENATLTVRGNTRPVTPKCWIGAGTFGVSLNNTGMIGAYTGRQDIGLIFRAGFLQTLGLGPSVTVTLHNPAEVVGNTSVVVESLVNATGLGGMGGGRTSAILRIVFVPEGNSWFISQETWNFLTYVPDCWPVA